MHNIRDIISFVADRAGIRSPANCHDAPACNPWRQVPDAADPKEREHDRGKKFDNGRHAGVPSPVQET
jgi:hypothetical protein